MDHSDTIDKSFTPQVEEGNSSKFKAGRNNGDLDFPKKLKTVDIVKRLWSNRRLRFWFIISVIVFKVLLTLLMLNTIPRLKDLPENIKHEGIKGMFASAAGYKSTISITTVTLLTENNLMFNSQKTLLINYKNQEL
jgi:hypothetical protein